MSEKRVQPAQTVEKLPAFLDLSQRRVLVVGGGTVAAAKLRSLVAAGAAITLVSPQVVPEAVVPGVRIYRRNFRERDLDGVWFVIAAATSGVNAAVTKLANRRRIFVNAVDDPVNATAYLAGTVRRGNVTVAISTGGRAPGLVRLLREALEQLLPEDVTRWLEIAEAERERWKKNKIDLSTRTPLLATIIRDLYQEK